MTTRETRFIEEYMIDSNATQAAIRAGYSPKTAGAAASRLLTNVNVSQAIKARETSLARRIRYSADKVLDGIAAIADDENARNAERLKAYELLGKHLGLFRDKIGVTLELPTIIDDWAAADDDEDGAGGIDDA